MTIEGDVVTTLLCAVPVNSNCTGPISWFIYVRYALIKSNSVITDLLNHTTSTDGIL
jgi:hypothetical protein